MLANNLLFISISISTILQNRDTFCYKIGVKPNYVVGEIIWE